MTDGRKRGAGWTRPMTKAEINECPMRGWSGPVTVVSRHAELPAALSALRAETILGFDTETRPAYKKGEHYPPSLLQLATEGEVFIFQLKKLGLDPELLAILADPAITKAGVGLDYDIRELRQLAPFKAAGFVDLVTLAKKAGVRNHGLRGLAAVLLGFRISKGAQTSNWAKDLLSGKQISYAATDAWVGRQLYLTLRGIAGKG
ncbi:MAG: 3'-5' exonuclease [Thermodesulfobacteriota bacterium]